MHCLLCETLTKNDASLCSACQALLPYAQHYCVQCGLSLENTSRITLCGRCLSDPPPYAHTVSCFWYEEPMASLLHAYKFKQHLFLAPILAHLMAQQIHAYYTQHACPLPECLIPVPLHAKRLSERGYNQATELARYLSKHFHLPYFTRFCKRMHHTPPQANQPAKFRHKNVRNTFSSKKIPFQRIAIIDDVMTTGATVGALSRVLKQQGGTEIHVWCCARTLSLRQ